MIHIYFRGLGGKLALILSLILTSLILNPSFVQALKAPHASPNITLCSDCHSRTGAGFATITSQNVLCINAIGCHNSGGRAQKKALSLLDASNRFGNLPAQSGAKQSSHGWKIPNLNPDAGVTQTNKWGELAVGPQGAALSNKILCTRCHRAHGEKAGYIIYDKFLRQTPTGNYICMQCHAARQISNVRDPKPADKHYSHPVEVNYSTVQAGKPDFFEKTPLNPYPSNLSAALPLFTTVNVDSFSGRITGVKGTGQVVCQTCHGPLHSADSNPYTFDNLTTYSKTGNYSTSSGNLLRRYPATKSNDLCSSCHKVKSHRDFLCSRCHAPHKKAGENNRYLIHENISTPNSGRKAVQLLSTSNMARRWQDDSTPIPVCQACHTQTRHHRNYSTTSADRTHNYLNDGTGKYKFCAKACHKHTSSFSHGSGSGGGKVEDCLPCHGHDQGYTFTYNSKSYISEGSGNKVTHSTHTENDADDIRGPNIFCTVCHDENNMPYFKTGTDTNADGKFELSETNVCDSCHSPGGSYNGVTSSNGSVGAKDNFKAINGDYANGGVYNQSDGSLKTGNEKWCFGCHDESPSTIGTETAPNKMGDNSTYGFFINGHGKESGNYSKLSHQDTTATGNPAANKNCADCHDSRKQHIVVGTNPTHRRLRAVTNNDATDQINVCNLCHTSNGAASAAPYFYMGPGKYTNSAHSVKKCTECHDVHGPSGAAPAMTKKDKQSLCYDCHTGGVVRNDAVAGFGVASSIKQAFNLGSKHPLGQSFSVGGKSYNLQCTSCHNVHVVTGKYWDAAKGKTPLTRFSNNTSPWGDKAGQKMKDFASNGTYDTPLYDVELGANFRADVMPDYPSFCLDCHSSFGGGGQGGINWDSNPHGRGQAGAPAAYGGHNYWSVGMQGFDAITPGYKAKRGRGGRDYTYAPWDAERRYAGANFTLACINCHEAHGSNGGGNLRPELTQQGTICQNCHWSKSELMNGGLFGCGSASCHQNDNIHRLAVGATSGGGTAVFDREHTVDVRFDSAWQFDGNHPGGFADVTKSFSNARFLNMSSSPITSDPVTTGLCNAGGWDCGRCDWLTTLSDVQARVVPGKVGSAVQLNGKQCVEIGTESCYSSTGTARGTAAAYEWLKTGTVEAWVYPDELTGTRYVIASNEKEDAKNWSLEITNDSTDTIYNQPPVFTDYRLVFRFHLMHFIPSTAAVYSNIPVPANQWTHVAAVYNADDPVMRVRLYMNGKDATGITGYRYGIFSQPPKGEEMSPATYANGSNQQPLMLGCDPGIIDNQVNNTAYHVRPFTGFKGKIDEFNLWNTVRTPEQIAQSYGAPRIASATGSIGSNQVTVTFSEGVYTSTGSTGALTAADFILTDTDNGRTITGVSHTAGATTAVLTLSSVLDSLNDIDLDTIAAATGSSIYDGTDAPMDTRTTVITAAAPSIVSITASDVGGANGIQAGDRVVIKFNQATQGNLIDKWNINAALALPGGHTWNDGSGNIGTAVWSTATSANDTLTITLSTASGVPTVAPGDMVTLGGTIKSAGGASLVDGHPISGTFDTGIFGGLPGGVVAYYNFAEGAGHTAHDTSGNGNDATLKNGALWTGGRTGIVPNYAASLNGSSTFVEAPDSNSLDLTSQGTIEVWAKKNSNREYQAYVGKYSTSGSALTQYGYMLGDANGQISLRWGRPQISVRDTKDDYYEKDVRGAGYRYYKAGKDDALLTDCDTAPVGQWNHILAAYDGAEIKIFLNGRLLKTGSYVKAADPNPYPLRIGASGISGDFSYENALDGAVDEVVVYNRALTNDEARERFGSPVQPNGAIAHDVGGSEGIQAGDKVIVRFDGPTNGATINTANIGTILSLNNGHVWGTIQGAVWSTAVFTNDTMTITLGTGATVDSYDIITTNGTVLKDRKGNAISATIGVSGKFGPLPNGAVAYYDFNEGTGSVVHDATINGNNGIAIGGTSWITGRNGQGYALDLNGSNAYVRVSECGDTPLDLTTQGTFEFWLKKNSSTTNTYPALITKGQTAVSDSSTGRWRSEDTLGYKFYASTNEKRLSVVWGGEGGSNSGHGPSYLDLDGEWKHIAVTYDGDAKFYVDGEPVGSARVSTQGRKSNDPVLLGAYPYFDDLYAPYFLDGALDQAIIYSRALSPEEVRENSGIPWKMKTAVAYDMGGASGIQTGDKVVITFNGPTQANSITAANIDTVLVPSSGKTWKSVNGSLANAAWSTNKFSNDTLTVILSDAGGIPTIAVGDTITLDGITIKDHKGRPVPVGSVVIAGIFDALPGDIVGYWNFAESSGTTASDSSTYRNHGTLQGSAAWTAGQSDGAIRLNGVGGSVRVDDSNSLDLITRDFYGIKLLSRTLGWAVGQSGSILKYTGTAAPGGGTHSWQRYYDSPTTNHLYGIDAVSATEAYAVGAGGVIIRASGSNSYAWGNVTYPVTTDLYGVDMLSSNSGWAVGKNNVILRFNGATWTPVAITSPTATWILRAVKMLSATEGWAVGGDNISKGVFLKWNGSTWTEFATTTATSLITSVDMLSSTSGWAVGLGGKIWKFDGTSWAEFVSPVAYDLHAVKALTATEAWAVGANRTILMYNGTAWAIQSDIMELSGLPTLRAFDSIPAEVADDSQWYDYNKFDFIVGDSTAIIKHSDGTWTSSGIRGFSWHGASPADAYDGATFEIRAKKNSNKADQTYLAKQYPESNSIAQISYRIKEDGATGKPAFTWNNYSNTPSQMICSEAAPIGQWNNIVVTVSGNGQKIYLNGQYCGSKTYGNAGLASSFPLMFGTGYYGSADFDGDIDQVTIYNRALSADEIWQKYGSNAVTFKTAVADDSSNGGYGIQAGDRVKITFNGPTRADAVTSANINTVLNVAAKTWLSGNGSLGSAVWSTTTWTNDTLTITLSDTGGAPTVAVGDTITISGLYDPLNRAMTGTVLISGSFGSDTRLWTIDYIADWQSGTIAAITPTSGDNAELSKWDVLTYDLRSVDMLSATEGWAVGERGAIRKFDGTQWKAFPSPLGQNPLTYNLNSVDMLSSTLGWAVGDGGKIIKFDGTKWIEETSPVTTALYAVKMISATEGWAAGASGKILKWDGTSWTSVTSPTTGSIYTLDAVSSTEVWAAGAISGPSILRWNGTSWTTVALAASATIRSLHMVSSSDGWAVGDSGVIFRYNGTSWVSATSPTTRALYSVRMISATEGWAFGGTGYISPQSTGIILKWNGTAWSLFASPEGPGYFYAANMLTSSDGWAVGLDGVIYRYNGTAWSAYSSVYSYTWINDVQFVSDTDGWAVGQGKVLRYNGTGWTNFANLTTKTFRGIDMLSSNEGWVAGPNDFFYRYLSGSWTSFANPAAVWINDIDMVSSTDGWAVGDSGTILRWNGSSWTSVTSPTANSILAIEMLSATEGWAVGGVGIILKWDGTSWTTVTSPTANTLTAIDMISSTEGWAVGYEGPSPQYGIVLKYNGTSWSQVSISTAAKGLQKILMRSSTEGMAVGYNGGVLTYDGNSWKYSETPTQSSDSYSNYAAAYTPSGTPWVASYAKLVKGVGYAPYGTVTNSHDAGWTVNWLTHIYEATTPANTSVSLRWATSNDATTWSAWTSDFAALADSRYIKQEVTLTSGDPSVTPSINKTTVEYKTGLIAGAVAFWDFDKGTGSTVEDATSNNNDISWGSNPASEQPAWITGQHVNAANFDGNDRGFVTYNTSQNFGTGNFSIETWLKFPSQIDGDTGGVGGAPISQRWSTGTGYEVVAGLPTAGKVRFKVNSDYVDTVSDGLNNDAWRHFIFVREGTTLKVYVNGVLDNTAAAAAGADVNNYRGISIGYARVWPDDYYSNWYKGSIDRTILYNRALSDAEATARANLVTTAPSAPTIGTATALSSTSIRWNFTDTANNETGFTLHDSAHAIKATSATSDRSYLDETGLAANTSYTRHVHAYNAIGDSAASADATGYTLASAPNVTPDRTALSWSGTANVIFVNAAGFGAGGVQYYRYAWDQNATYTWTGSETQWTTGTLTPTAIATGGWYLHVKAYNGQDAAGSTQDYGPFNYETVAPAQVAGLWSSAASTSSANLGWTASSDTGGSGLAGYKVERAVDINGTPETYVQSGTTTSNTWSDTGLLANAKYWHRVRAYDNAGNNGTYSTVLSVMTLPVVPSVSANKTPTNWYNTTDVVFTNSAGFGAGGLQYYRVAWDQNATYTFTGAETQWSSGTLTTTAAATGGWYLHLKSYNTDGVANGTADYGPYNYETTPPSGLLSSAPADGGIDMSTSTTLTSSAATDGQSGSVQYYFEVATDSGFSTSVQNSGWQAGTTFAPTLSAGTTYYWHVKAKDGALNETAYTATRSFTTVSAPSAPTMGAVAALTTTSIRWNFADTANNETGFRLHDPAHAVKASAATVDLTYLDESGLVANTQYTRHVHAYSAAGDSAGSSDALRYTLSVAPNVTADKTASTWYNTTDVIFTNAAGFGAGGVQNYRYAWDQNATHTFDDTEPQWTTGTLTRTATVDGSWYLHVKSFNGDNVANGTQTYGPFYYDSTTPSGLANSTPADGATGQATSTAVVSTVATDGGSGSVQYYFQVALDSGFTTGLQNSGWQAGTSFSPTLAADTTYYWHVKAKDGAVNETAYTATRSFTVASFTPSSTASGATANSAQRKTFYDGVNSKHWAFYYNGTAIEYVYSADGTAWTLGGTLPYNTSDFSVTYKNIGGTGYVFIAAVSNTDDVVVKRGTLGATSITFGSEYTAFDGTSASDSYNSPTVALDADNNFVWVGGVRDTGVELADHLQPYVRRSTNAGDGDLSAWQAAANVGRKVSKLRDLVMMPRTGSGMYLLMNTDTPNIVGYAYNGTSWSGANAGGDYSWFSFPGGISGTVNAMVVSGTNMYVGGLFTGAGGNVNGSRIARWDMVNGTWNALGTGLNGTVSAIAVSGNDVYVGGAFTSTQDGAANAYNRIARWDTLTSTWNTVGATGLSSTVNAIAVSGTDIYVGGAFTTTQNGATAGTTGAYNRIARWDTLTSTWNTVGTTGLNSTVYAIAVSGSNLYAGGTFTTTMNLTTAGTANALNRIARWDGATWNAVGTTPTAGATGNGVNGTVWAIAVSGTDVYVGGAFATAYNSTAAAVTVNYIARLDASAGTGTWNAMGTGLTASSIARAIAISGANVYVGGNFTTAGGSAANRIAKWDGSAWSATDATGLGGTSTYAYTLAVSGSSVYAGGNFIDAGGNVNADNIAKLDGATWSAMGSSGMGSMSAVAVIGTDVYVGGSFTDLGGNINADYIARWDSAAGSWNALGAGLNSAVYAFRVLGTNLYIGGNFTSTQGGPANAYRYIARWDAIAQTWNTAGGNLFDAYIVSFDMTADNNIYVASNKTGGIHRWDGGSWSILGSGLGAAYGTAVATDGTYVYATGGFTDAGGDVNADYIARWNISSGLWSSMGSGLTAAPDPASIAVSGTNVYVAGNFTAIGGVPANRIAWWNGSIWGFMGTGLNGNVSRGGITVVGTDVYVGGAFTDAGGNLSADNIARWDSTNGTWNAVDTGMSGGVSGIAASGTDIYAVGSFTASGSGQYGSHYFSRYGLAAATDADDTTEVSSVTSGDNVLMVYTNSSDNVKFRRYNGTTSTWDATVTLRAATCSSPNVSRDTTTGDLYVSWIEGNTVYYKKGVFPFASGDWDVNPTAVFGTGTNLNLTSDFNFTTATKDVLMWTNGTGSPYSVKTGVVP